MSKHKFLSLGERIERELGIPADVLMLFNGILEGSNTRGSNTDPNSLISTACTNALARKTLEQPDPIGERVPSANQIRAFLSNPDSFTITRQRLVAIPNHNGLGVVGDRQVFECLHLGTEKELPRIAIPEIYVNAMQDLKIILDIDEIGPDTQFAPDSKDVTKLLTAILTTGESITAIGVWRRMVSLAILGYNQDQILDGIDKIVKTSKTQLHDGYSELVKILPKRGTYSAGKSGDSRVVHAFHPVQKLVALTPTISRKNKDGSYRVNPFLSREDYYKQYYLGYKINEEQEEFYNSVEIIIEELKIEE